MTRSRVLAAAAVATLLVGAVLIWGGRQPASFATPVTAPVLEAAPEPPVLVDPDVLDQHAAEPEVIDEATVSTTSTVVASTTTLAPTTTEAEAETEEAEVTATTAAPSPSPTSPPTTQAPTTTAAPSGGYSSGAESEFASSINSYRSSNGLAALSRSGSLDSYARSWAKQMAGNGGLSHSNIGSLLGEWSSVAENIGVGGSAGSIFGALADSSGHRANMLGDFTHIGIGAYLDSAGNLWTCHVFAR